MPEEAAKPEDDTVTGPDPVLAETGRQLFARPWIFIRGVPSMKFLPPEGPPEIAFAGRCNPRSPFPNARS